MLRVCCENKMRFEMLFAREGNCEQNIKKEMEIRMQRFRKCLVPIISASLSLMVQDESSEKSFCFY